MNKIQQRLKILLYFTILTITGFGCASTENKPLVIGAIYNLHGEQSNLDIPSSRGARLAVAEINRNGGSLGRLVKLALVDGNSKAKVISRKAAALLKRYPDMSAFLGFSDPEMVLAAAPVAADSGRLFLTSGATSPLLPSQVPEYLFLACFGDNVQAAAAAESAWNDLNAQTVAVLYDKDHTYTRLLQGYFRTRYIELGGTVSVTRPFTLDKLEGISDGLKDVDLVFLATETAESALAIIQRLRAAGITTPILGGDAYDSEQLWQQHPEIHDVYFTTHAYLGEDNLNPLVQNFRKAYSDAYDGDHPDAFAALGYDTVRLLMTAIDHAGSSDPVAIRLELAGIRNFTGVTGTMYYPKNSRIPIKSVSILNPKSKGSE